MWYCVSGFAFQDCEYDFDFLRGIGALCEISGVLVSS